MAERKNYRLIVLYKLWVGGGGAQLVKDAEEIEKGLFAQQY